MCIICDDFFGWFKHNRCIRWALFGGSCKKMEIISSKTADFSIFIRRNANVPLPQQLCTETSLCWVRASLFWLWSASKVQPTLHSNECTMGTVAPCVRSQGTRTNRTHISKSTHATFTTKLTHIHWLCAITISRQNSSSFQECVEIVSCDCRVSRSNAILWIADKSEALGRLFESNDGTKDENHQLNRSSWLDYIVYSYNLTAMLISMHSAQLRTKKSKFFLTHLCFDYDFNFCLCKKMRIQRVKTFCLRIKFHFVSVCMAKCGA